MIEIHEGGGGYYATREFEDGTVAGIYVLSPDCVRMKTIKATDVGTYEWCYESKEEAVEALRAWDGIGEPTGWQRRVLTAGRHLNP